MQTGRHVKVSVVYRFSAPQFARKRQKQQSGFKGWQSWYCDNRYLQFNCQNKITNHPLIQGCQPTLRQDVLFRGTNPLSDKTSYSGVRTQSQTIRLIRSCWHWKNWRTIKWSTFYFKYQNYKTKEDGMRKTTCKKSWSK